MGIKRLLTIAALLCTAVALHADPALIPQPVKLERQSGNAVVDTSWLIVCYGKQDAAKVLSEATGIRILPQGVRILSTGEHQIRLAHDTDTALGDEGYRLSIQPSAIRISANSEAGFFYGVQTLLQFFPPIESMAKENTWELPCVTIEDYPRFGWRGLMLDVSRHFFTKDEVKLFIDRMARYKFNVFHFHLNDDQGWRIEIPGLPKLTEVGSKRVKRTGIWWHRDKPLPGELRNDGGFYTLDDIKEIINYAAKRHVTVVPEIDVPGHALAMLAAYPEVACKLDTYEVNAGWKFYNIEPNTVCVGSDKTYEVMDQILDVVAKTFPAEYIHIGGDEATKKWWNACPKCQALKEREGLKDGHGLQSHFIKRMEAIIEGKGKKLIGWDEIHEGGLPPNAAVMSWRGIGGGVEAAKKGHKVVMTPKEPYYLDLYQGDPIIEPNTYDMARFRECYEFEPQPKTVPDSLMLGIQGNLWAESIPNYRHVEYMAWPRAFAVAESAWSPKGRKNWPDFMRRVESHFKRFDASDINYATSVYNVNFRPKKAKDGSLVVELWTELDDLTIRYTFDNTNPDHHSTIYTAPLSIPLTAADLKVNTFRGNKKIGTQINMPIAELKKRAGVK